VTVTTMLVGAEVAMFAAVMVVATTLRREVPLVAVRNGICSPARSVPVEGPGVAGARAAVMKVTPGARWRS